MKKLIIVLMAVALVAGFSGVSMAAITGSAHDFSNDGWNNTGEICVVCHTPHNADISVTDSPLWNHQVTDTVFTLYSSPTMDAVVGQPTGVSKLCLSCHDGTVALDNFGGKTNGTNFISGSKNLGTSMADDHPISFTYDATLATTDGELFDPTNTNANIIGGVGTITEDMLFGDQMECASCHDVHNTNTGPNDLLVKDNNASALCLTCHNK